MAVDLSKLAFYSGTRYERTALKSHVAFSLAAFGVQTLTVAHNLGYVPYYKLFYAYGDGKYFQMFAGNGSYAIDGNGGQVDNIYPDSTNIYIELSENNGSPISGTIYYRIYAEPQV
jgi:hypothetical protein